jgi:uncharacterized protein YqeY
MLLDIMRSDLSRALKSRDRRAIAVLRTTLAAIANAEAPPAQPVDISPVVGQSAEVQRLTLEDADIERIVRHEIADRRDTIARYEVGGRSDDAESLRAELAILESYLR